MRIIEDERQVTSMKGNGIRGAKEVTVLEKNETTKILGYNVNIENIRVLKEGQFHWERIVQM